MASVWDMATGKEMSKLEGHSAAVNCVAISKDGKTIVSGSGGTDQNGNDLGDNTIR
jgi:WD40 repeat protein